MEQVHSTPNDMMLLQMMLFYRKIEVQEFLKIPVENCKKTDGV